MDATGGKFAPRSPKFPNWDLQDSTPPYESWPKAGVVNGSNELSDEKIQQLKEFGASHIAAIMGIPLKEDARRPRKRITN